MDDRTVYGLDRVIGGRLRSLRRAAGLTQEELSEALAEVPTLPAAWRHRQTVGSAEEGTRRFTIEDVVGLSAFFGVPIAFLLDAPEAEVDDVGVGGARIERASWRRFVIGQMPGRDKMITLDEQAGISTAVMRELGGLDDLRPWARFLRRREAREVAFGKARAEHLARRGRRLPGPTVEAVEDVSTGGLKLSKGQIFTARDDIEADLLRRLIDRGLARRRRPRKGKST